MRHVRAALLATSFLTAGAVHAPAQELHPISDAEIRALAYAGCVEAGVEPKMGEYLVQYSIYMRGIDDRPDWGGWNLVRVTHYSKQYEGVWKRRECEPSQMVRSMEIARDIVDVNFDPGGWKDVRYFMAPCYSTSGGIAGFRSLVYVGTYGGHDFYREPLPGERGRALSCRESPTYEAYRRSKHRHHRHREPEAPEYVAQW